MEVFDYFSKLTRTFGAKITVLLRAASTDLLDDDEIISCRFPLSFLLDEFVERDVLAIIANVLACSEPHYPHKTTEFCSFGFRAFVSVNQPIKVFCFFFSLGRARSS